ncbi:hypothetical protein A3C23_01735 [Candidatus Roizmanbacteria bacterium RIFCSPHIGHO2_02_FULL_37_13b]|uniref:HicB-like antitoxin of toxin-antitoxin system domain-containing protein n=1 Tax=Candidatus Roizmanbacteria bacterium RIFCSPLOWO2_02_FULL_36_11 TaxID=1802071 RepID=A0A1F7JCZ2_9BACT|nr:MAG: hypothetical protein A3C23_01735 [Candidatus Roizmanbacteria bacterium RIFCSPHIGHO2_02_FULL_37_13b]OGK53457.1 MAG: hypothetical protein A3H78_02895 [Candidatus Roizmanbacteria bacterium RIFCSPLOWO2_02_FULL_36_11]
MKIQKTKEKILKYDVVFEEAEEGGYTAHVPTLPGCISEGDCFEKAKENITEAITAYLESLAKDNADISFSQGNFVVSSVEIPLSKLSFT